MKTFDIVIVNWNSGVQLKECINSINETVKKNCKLNNIIVVDNASNDHSLDIIALNDNNIVIINNKNNFGFGKACNQGASIVKDSDFVLFLNPDMLLFEDTFLNFFDYIEKNDTPAIAVYGIQLVDKKGVIQRNCARLPKLSNFIVRGLGLNKINPHLFKSYTMENWEHDRTMEVDQVMGAFFMIKKDIYDKLDGFDERFFVYYEELDLSKRVKDLGYKTLFISESKAYHKGGGTSENVKAKRLFYNTRSKLIYGLKHFNIIEALFLIVFTFILELFTRILFLIIKGKFSEIIETLRGFWMLYKDTLNVVRLGLQK